MRRIMIVVTVLCALAFATELIAPAAEASAAAVDAPTLLLADQSPGDGAPRCVVRVPALSPTVLAAGALLVRPAPQPPWLAGPACVLRRGRPPPREPALDCVSPLLATAPPLLPRLTTRSAIVAREAFHRHSC